MKNRIIYWSELAMNDIHGRPPAVGDKFLLEEENCGIYITTTSAL